MELEILSTDFRSIFNPIFIKIRPVRAELFHVGVRKDMINSRSSQFCERT